MEFPIPNETATEQSKRLKGVVRTSLVATLDETLQRVKQIHKDLPVDFLVQTRPFSTNKMSGARKTYETKEYLEFRDVIARKAGGFYGVDKKMRFRLVVIAAFSNKKGDLDNVFKPLLDSMVASMDDAFDDSQVYEIQARKKLVKKGQEFLQVRLELIGEDEYNSWWDV